MEQDAGRGEDNQLGPIISANGVRREDCPDVAGKPLDASDQGRGVIKVENLVGSDNGAILNFESGERQGLGFGFRPEH